MTPAERQKIEKTVDKFKLSEEHIAKIDEFLDVLDAGNINPPSLVEKCKLHGQDAVAMDWDDENITMELKADYCLFIREDDKGENIGYRAFPYSQMTYLRSSVFIHLTGLPTSKAVKPAKRK